MRTSDIVPLSAVVALAIGLVIVDVTTDVNWAWWAIVIVLAAAVPAGRSCSGSDVEDRRSAPSQGRTRPPAPCPTPRRPTVTMHRNQIAEVLDRPRSHELSARDIGMVRIVVTPTWAKLVDVDTTVPSAVEELVCERAARA